MLATIIPPALLPPSLFFSRFMRSSAAATCPWTPLPLRMSAYSAIVSFGGTDSPLPGINRRFLAPSSYFPKTGTLHLPLAQRRPVHARFSFDLPSPARHRLVVGLQSSSCLRCQFPNNRGLLSQQQSPALNQPVLKGMRVTQFQENPKSHTQRCCATDATLTAHPLPGSQDPEAEDHATVAIAASTVAAMNDQPPQGQHQQPVRDPEPTNTEKDRGLVGQGGRSIDDFYSGYGLPPFKELPGKTFTVRVRQHVNPLKSCLVGPTQPPDWGEVFEDPTLPLFLDVGCASGRLTLVMAMRRQGMQNVLGLEIRKPLVDRANLWAEQLGLRNAHFRMANATLFLGVLLSSYPGQLTNVCVLCPDPQFKKKHKKRRIVQPRLVEAVANKIAPGGEVFLQSDILEVAADMRDQFHAHAGELFGSVGNCDEEGWLRESPLGVPSEREAVVLSKGNPVYRTLLQRV